MAAAAETTQTVTLTINGIDVQVPKGEMVVESVKRIGLDIPIFCYHPRLKPVGMCRMCLIEVGTKGPDGEVRMMPKPQAACTLPATDGLIINTESEQLEIDRKGVIEFLLLNHPLDCPICDRGGECPLQNNVVAYGPGNSRFIDEKGHAAKAFPLSKYVTLDLERCIQCGRCVRFTEEISGDAQLAFRFRGSGMQPSTFDLTDFDSKFSGNVIEICPVGALTSSEFRFRARPWDLQTSPGICTLTPCGTNVWFDHRDGKLSRINGRVNEAVNEEWTCDRTKFGHGDIYAPSGRISAPHVRKGDDFEAVNWSAAWKPILEAFDSESGVIAGPSVSNEDLFMMKNLFRFGFKSGNFDHRSGGLDALPNRLVDCIGTTIAELENKDAILVFGTELSDEEPMTFLRVRKGWFNNGTKVVVACDTETDADSFAHAILRYKPGSELAAAHAIAAALDGKSASAEDLKASGLDAAALEAAASAVKGADTAVLTTRSLLAKTGGADAASWLAKAADGQGASFSLMATQANEQGALELGFVPDSGKNTREMLEAAKAGKLKALWLANYDPLTQFPDVELAEAALENVEFLVVQAANETECAAYASVILPMTLPAEQDGTYTNVEGRVQKMDQILQPVGEAKPMWRACSDALRRIDVEYQPPFSAGEVFEQISKEHPKFMAVTEDALKGEGALISTPETEPGQENQEPAGGQVQ